MALTRHHTRVLSFFFFFHLSCSTLSVLSHMFSPIDNYLINCGSSESTTAVDFRRFSGDLSGNHHSPLPSSSNGAFPLRNKGNFLDLPSIYRTAMVFNKPTKYVFPIKEQGTHMVRLHFFAFNSTRYDLGQAQFHVLVNGFVVLSNSRRVISSEKPMITEYLIKVLNEEHLVIHFVPTKDSRLAFVNAIEVISAPKDLVPETATYLSSKGIENFNGLSNQAIEVVYRVTVGGPKITPFNDSLWRTWIPDNEFLRSSFGSERLYFGGRIKYHAGGASREVGPDNMYNSARLIKSNNDSVPNVNVTWEFPIIGGYKYLVRLHFCDIASIQLGLLYFNVYVNGYLALQDLDLSSITGSLASPFYADFIVDGNGIENLSVAIGPSNSSIPYVYDAILNGVEVMKMNNSHNSLDGEVCAGFVLKNWASGNESILLTFIAAICILLSIFIVVRRKIIDSRNYVPWSRLPMNVSEDNEIKT
ncbi:hypothetical protein HN51_020979 [Arachis hypogaea]|uniref:Malectin-like domain-containing protein n=4 Tax=Arachis hypogaea TaxID=3818 RepID=A0A445EIJ8_ARAHY|nr:probable receptor-like protein kinase At5g24010 [Arachis hypogaea]QHO51852.1 putative receptor-like protein kinase [Arachis hypogaea]RYR75244.1 hypothetical protein Ahy_A02g009912 isoform A [Arachis hypogaea]